MSWGRKSPNPKKCSIHHQIVEFYCSKSLEKARKDVKNVEMCKKLWKM